MKADIINFNTSCSKIASTEAASMKFVRHLLALALVDKDDELIIEPCEFFYDPVTDVQTTKVLRSKLNSVNILGTSDTVEVNVSGSVKTLQGSYQSFSLLLFLWQERSASILSGPAFKGNRNAGSLEIRFADAAVSLRNSVFVLDLFRENKTGSRWSMGNGHGFLYFDEV